MCNFSHIHADSIETHVGSIMEQRSSSYEVLQKSYLLYRMWTKMPRWLWEGEPCVLLPEPVKRFSLVLLPSGSRCIHALMSWIRTHIMHCVIPYHTILLPSPDSIIMWTNGSLALGPKPRLKQWLWSLMKLMLNVKQNPQEDLSCTSCNI